MQKTSEIPIELCNIARKVSKLDQAAPVGKHLQAGMKMFSGTCYTAAL
jgi:hypothetical protein